MSQQVNNIITILDFFIGIAGLIIMLLLVLPRIDKLKPTVDENEPPS